MFTDYLLWATFLMRECGIARDADRQGAGLRGDEWSFPLLSRHKVEERTVI